MFDIHERANMTVNDFVQLNLMNPVIVQKDEKTENEVPDTTNIVVTKFIDSNPNLLEVGSTLDLNKKGKLIEVEFIDTLESVENKSQAELSPSPKKKLIRKKDLTDNKGTSNEVKKRKKSCSVCGKEYVKNHELYCKPRDITKPLHSVGPALCSKCGKHFSSNFNLKRHMSACKLCPDEERGPRYICECGRTYSQETDLKKHKVKCEDGKKKCKPCLIGSCNLLFYHKAQLVQHMKRDHCMRIQDPEILSFSCFNDFLLWKEKEEEETYTYYSKQTGSNVTGISVNTYYVCQHDGSERSHNNNPKKTERRNKKGRIKTGRLCWSQMNVKQFKDGTVKVTYFPSHTHPITISDTKHHPLPLSITMEIKRRLSLLNAATDETHSEHTDFKKGRKKKYGLTLRALKSLARKNRNLFRITNEAVQQTENNILSDSLKEEPLTTNSTLLDPNEFGMNYSVEEEENVDDPMETPQSVEPIEQIELEVEKNDTSVDVVEQLKQNINEIKTMVESSQLDNTKLVELNETLVELISKYKIQPVENQMKADLGKLDLLDDKSSVLNILEEQNEEVMKTEPKSSLEDNAAAVYEILTDNSQYVCQNAVELVGAREFIIISADHAQYFQALPSNIYVEQELE